MVGAMVEKMVAEMAVETVALMVVWKAVTTEYYWVVSKVDMTVAMMDD